MQFDHDLRQQIATARKSVSLKNEMDSGSVVNQNKYRCHSLTSTSYREIVIPESLWGQRK